MARRGEEPLPILFVTEMVGLALGLAPADLGMNRHFVDTAPFMTRLVQQAAERVVAEKLAKEEAAAKAAARAEKQKVSA
jgi:adenosyl cobinamide kinase/adenosyl cobinamide phosphate guanylyltransferase